MIVANQATARSDSAQRPYTLGSLVSGKPRGRQRSRLGQRGQAVKADGVVVLPVGLESVGSALGVI